VKLLTLIISLQHIVKNAGYEGKDVETIEVVNQDESKLHGFAFFITEKGERKRLRLKCLKKKNKTNKEV